MVTDKVRCVSGDVSDSSPVVSWGQTTEQNISIGAQVRFPKTWKSSTFQCFPSQINFNLAKINGLVFIWTHLILSINWGLEDILSPPLTLKTGVAFAWRSSHLIVWLTVALVVICRWVGSQDVVWSKGQSFGYLANIKLYFMGRDSLRIDGLKGWL